MARPHQGLGSPWTPARYFFCFSVKPKIFTPTHGSVTGVLVAGCVGSMTVGGRVCTYCDCGVYTVCSAGTVWNMAGCVLL